MMNLSATTEDTASILAEATCDDINSLLASLNDSFFESRNTTRDVFSTKIRTPHCLPKPYEGVQGLRKWLTAIILITFLVCGLIGNILSSTIMFRRSRRGLSSYFYLALLAIADICVLYSGGLLSVFDIAFNFHPLLKDKLYCRIGFYIKHLFTYLSAWLVVAVTFERFIVVRFPFQSIRVCRLHVAHGITLIIFMFFSIYTLHCFFTLDIQNYPMHTENGYHPDYLVCDLVKYRRLLSLIDLCFYSIIPSILILIFNSLIISTMLYAIKQRRNYLQANSGLHTSNTTSHRNQNRKNKSSSSMRSPFFRSRSLESTPIGRPVNSQNRSYRNGFTQNSLQKKAEQTLIDSTSATGIRLTCLLLIISFIFVICTLPISIRSLINDLFPGYNSTTHWQITQLTLTILMYFNHAINFMLYCLTGRAFRHECRKLLGDIWRFKGFRISCMVNSDSEKHHHYRQQMPLTTRSPMVISQKQVQRMKRSYL